MTFIPLVEHSVRRRLIATLSSANYGPFQIDNPIVKAYYLDGSTEISVTIKITFARVEFSENSSQMYGFDPNNRVTEIYYPSYSDVYGWKSIEVGYTDKINAEMLPMGIYEHVTFVSSSPDDFPVTPTNPTSDQQVVELGGYVLGSASIISNIGNTEGCEHHGFNSQVKTVTYPMSIKYVKIVVVEEENDDEQVISVGEGNKKAVAIGPGPNGILDTSPSGDDQVMNNTIITGENWICNSIAQSDDEQIIGIGNCAAFQLCVDIGPNMFRDTPMPLGDDQLDGDQINTGPDCICQTEALNVNTNHINSSQANGNTIIENINDIYRQAIFEWEYLIPIISTEAINYDLDRDGKIKVATAGFSNNEIDKIKANCLSCSPMDYNVILIDETNVDDVPGFSLANSNYSFALRDPNNEPYFFKTIAHELGHTGFGLRHPFEEFHGEGYPLPPTSPDKENLMDYGTAPIYKLRKYQWDQIHGL